MRYIFFPFVLLYIFSLPLNYAQTKTSSYHPFSNAFVFTLDFGGTIAYTDFTFPELGYFGRLSFEYFLSSKSIHSLGIKFSGGGGFINAEFENTEMRYPPPIANFRTGIIFIGGGLTYIVKLGDVVPYLSLLISHLKFDPKDKSGNFRPSYPPRNYNLNVVMYTGELGIKFPFSEFFSLNLGGNINFANTDNLDDVDTGFNNDAFVTAFLGLSFYLGAEKD